MSALTRSLSVLIAVLFVNACSDEGSKFHGNPHNVGPTITSTAPTTATEDQLWQYQVEVEDPDDKPSGIYFALVNPPAGMTVSRSGLISWTPPNGILTAAVTVIVADGGENRAVPDSQTFNLRVTPVNDGPTITSAPRRSAISGTPYSYQLSVLDVDDPNNGSALTFTLLNGPAGMTLSNRGLIEWTPSAAGDVVDVEVEVRDGGEDGAAPDTQAWSITVVAGNTAPIITSAAVTAATEGQPYSYQLQVLDYEDDNNGADLTFSLLTAPAGMTVSSHGLIEWTPTDNGAAVWPASVEVQVADGGEDGALPDAQSFDIMVTPVNTGPSITSVAPATATEAATYSYQLVVDDIDDANNGTDLTFSLISAPAGMTVSSTGLIEWTPPNGVTSADVVIEVADGGENGAAAATQSWTITVGATNDAPTITSSAVTTATEDQPYSYRWW